MNTLFSVGHSNLSWPNFQSLVEKYDLGAIVDVRTRPRSRLSHFHGSQLRHLLNGLGISYIWIGDRLGGMPVSGAANYSAMAKSAVFLDGISQVVEIAGRTRFAICCAEHEHLDCHRSLLIGRHLLRHRGINVSHIHRDGTCEPHTEGEDRLLSRWDGGGDLFRTREQRLDVAYRLQARKIGVEA